LRANELALGRHLQILLAAGKGAVEIIRASASTERHAWFQPICSTRAARQRLDKMKTSGHVWGQKKTAVPRQPFPAETIQAVIVTACAKLASRSKLYR
jgi:hypothetical protein